MQNGKGDSPRPVDREKFESNYDEIQWNEKRCSGDCSGGKVCHRNLQEKGVGCKDIKIEQKPK
jgi:hypothetical protein